MGELYLSDAAAASALALLRADTIQLTVLPKCTNTAVAISRCGAPHAVATNFHTAGALRSYGFTSNTATVCQWTLVPVGSYSAVPVGS